MSNEMISVPREQLQRWLDDIGNSRHVTEYAARKREALRALLAKPAKPAKSECTHCLGDSMFGCAECEPDDLGQHQGEPVAMVRTHGSVCWEEITGESLELCQAQPEEYEVRILYTRPAEQPDTGTNSDKYKAELCDEVWQLARDMGFGNVTDALMKLQSQLQGNKSR